MNPTFYFNFNIPYSMLTTKNLVSIHHRTADPLYLFYSSSYPFPSVLCIYMFVWFVHLFCLFFFIFHIWVKSYSI